MDESYIEDERGNTEEDREILAEKLSVESLIKSRIPPNLQEVVRLIVKMEVLRAKEKIMEEVDFLLRKESARQEGK